MGAKLGAVARGREYEIWLNHEAISKGQLLKLALTNGAGQKNRQGTWRYAT